MYLALAIMMLGVGISVVTDQARPLTFLWREFDTLRGLTVTAFLGSLGALALAVFGLPPLDIHSPLHHMGIMDPLCGMTRAVRAVAMGRFDMAYAYNPGSFALAGGAMFLFARHAVGWATGRWLGVRVSLRRSLWPIFAAGLVALWLNQQLHADLLMRFGMEI